jgi:predicted nuclease with TOPRIM domain
VGDAVVHAGLELRIRQLVEHKERDEKNALALLRETMQGEIEERDYHVSELQDEKSVLETSLAQSNGTDTSELQQHNTKLEAVLQNHSNTIVIPL